MDMGPHSARDKSSAEKLLALLTDRQTAVMELAAEHKSNKLIARELGISPSTVEQRMGYVRDKLETSDRNSTIRRFVELRTICGKSIYGVTHLEYPSNLDQFTRQELESDGFVQHSTILEAFDAKYGRLGRVGLVFAVAVAMALIGLLVMSIATSLSTLLGASA